MNCIIIDDEATARTVLQKLCLKANRLNVNKEFDNANDALIYLETNKIDLIFLDLHMPRLSGYDFLDIQKSNAKVILTTTDRDAAIKAFEYKCIVDFLGKPFKIARFLNALDKVNRAIKITNNHQKALGSTANTEDLFVNINKKLIKVKVNDINFIKAYNKSIMISTNERNFVIKSDLTKVLEKLPVYLFLRVHQSYIINVSKIIDINNKHLLINNDSIPLSKVNQRKLLKRINLV